MKKSIQQFVAKLDSSNSGLLKGGFGSLKGGFALPSTNSDHCTNGPTGICKGTNSGVCTNSGDCTGTTNSSPSCTNSGTCFA